MIKNKFLLIPFLILLLAYTIDKLLLLENIQTYFTKTMSEVNYFHKPELFEELKIYLQQNNRKKVLVYFGNSRALLFNNAYIEKKYPDWILFNFSVPGGTPDYFLFWLEKFEKENVRPDFILLDNSIEAFNLKAFIKIDEVLVNGLDFNFIIRHNARYSKKEITNFIAKRTFRTYQYRPKFTTVLERIKNDFLILNMYRSWRKKTKERLTLERGSASSEFASGVTSKEEVVKKYAEGDYHSYLTPYEFNFDMLKFQKDCFEILSRMKIPHSGIWVRIAPPYLELIKNRQVARKEKEVSTVYEIWYPKLKKIHTDTNTEFWNMNEDPSYKCNDFSDASHMSPSCFPDYTDFIFRNIFSQTRK
ncbi:MAG: DUF1574 domain-containing protein [Leptospiraceae bacterium]|nr:DUF1574 domain-containing protein [Leptospiraceae bacterium]MCK6382624.1 DUF1574 domain-containing protein [Leptospiraceae bacterium]NUM41885.1 DUF1574 domain-containing protein [Leptospiraceae bacterium]